MKRSRTSACWQWVLVAGLLTLSFNAAPLPLRGEETLSTRDIPGIVFSGGPVVDGEYEKLQGAYHWRDGYVYPKGATNNNWERTSSAPRPGRNLFALVPATPSGKLTQLTFLKTGNVYDPEPSFDGKRVLFSMRKDDEDWFHLFEVNIDGSGLKQLTDGPFNDISGTYLPDGRIVFCSDRTGVLDEYHEERSEFLFRMNADGSGIEQLTFVPGSYFEPTVLRNGLILCSFWDAFHISVPPFIKHETYLITLRPDGTEERHFFGAGEYKFYNRTRHAAIGLTKPGEMPDGRILVQSEMGPSIYDPNIGTQLGLSLAPVFPGTSSVQTGGTTHTMHLSPLGTRSTPYPLQDGRFLMAATLSGSRDFGLYAVDPATRSMQKIFDRPNLSEWDPVPVAVSRPLPRILPDHVVVSRDPTGSADADDARLRLAAKQNPKSEIQNPKSSNTATFVVVAGRHSDTLERNELNRRARFVRVLQTEYTTLAISSHTSLETRVLGTVPIQPDGSIAFEAPADTPLFLETLDARGNRLVLQAGYMSARAGEVKSCVGCHAPQSEAAPNEELRALKLPLPRITRDSTDLSYRRNEPDEYRRHALITQAPLYRSWLDSKDSEVRRRGLEMLSYLPDEVTTPDRKRFIALLTDRSPEVSVQAAFALAMTGSADEIPGLIAILPSLVRQETVGPYGTNSGARSAAKLPLNSDVRDWDWRTLHYVAMALEAITGENLDAAADINRAVTDWTEWWHGTGSVEKFLNFLTARGEKFADEFERDAWLEAVGRTRWLSDHTSRLVAEKHRTVWLDRIHKLLAASDPPAPAVIRAAGMLGDRESVPLIARYLIGGAKSRAEETVPDSDEALRREVEGLAVAKEAAIALGRIGNNEAVAALWGALAKSVPNRDPIPNRHYQVGPRPEEYTYLRALIYAGAVPKSEHVSLLIGMLPSTFGEKPRFEDRTRNESQRATLARILLERSGLREKIVKLAEEVLRETASGEDELYKQVLTGFNLKRPYSEHGHPFAVLKELHAEQALQLIACFAVDANEVPELLVAARLRTNPERNDVETSYRERIEAACILRRFGFSQPETTAALLAEIRQPYDFREIWSIGKGRADNNYRDKAYLLMALAAHIANPQDLIEFADYTKYYRDIRIGLALGLGFRGKADGLPVLQQLARDPIFSVYRECENAVIQIRDAEMFAGRTVPEFELPSREALRPEYVLHGVGPAQSGSQVGAFEFLDRTPDPLALPDSLSLDVNDPHSVVLALQSAIDAKQYANVGNTFARNASRMRIFDSGLLVSVIESPTARSAPLTPELEQAITSAIDSPFPFAHYLVSRLIVLRNEKKLVPLLVQKLPVYVAAADTVGFYWTADALGQLRAAEAVEPLSQFATEKTFPNVYGSVGMAYGFAAARAVGMIVGDSQRPELGQLLASENAWLRAGALDGLTSRGNREATVDLRKVLAEFPSALVEEQARYGLRTLNP